MTTKSEIKPIITRVIRVSRDDKQVFSLSEIKATISIAIRMKMIRTTTMMITRIMMMMIMVSITIRG